MIEKTLSVERQAMNSGDPILSWHGKRAELQEIMLIMHIKNIQ